MSLEKALQYALKNKIESRGRTSISRFGTYLTDGYSHYYGHNSYKSCSLQAKYAKETGCPEKVHVHSEIAAIASAIRSKRVNLSGYCMYIARVLSDGSPALAKPCLGCMAAIVEFGIKEVYYTE